MVLPATLDPNGPLNDSIGVLYVGTVVSAVLHGLCILQVFLYFQKYKQDLWLIKAAVITVLFFDATHLFMIAAGVYQYLIVNYHDQNQLQYLNWQILIEALFVGMNGAVVQVFYTYRVWLLSKHNWWICGFILLLVLGEVGSGIAWVILSMKMKTFHDLLRLTPLAISINVLSCSIDILIAGSLCLLLQRARTGYKRSDSIINRLMVFVINTGLLTTVFAVSAFICLVSSPNSLIYAGFYFCLGRLYTNSFLATLNARSTFKNPFDETELKPYSVTPQGTTTSKTKSINIRIETAQESIRDKEQTLVDSESMPTKGRSINSDDVLLRKSHLDF